SISRGLGRTSASRLTTIPATGIIPADWEVALEETVSPLSVYRRGRRRRCRGGPHFYESQARRAPEEAVSQRRDVLAAHGEPAPFHGVFNRSGEESVGGSAWLCVLDDRSRAERAWLPRTNPHPGRDEHERRPDRGRRRLRLGALRV